MIAQRRFGPLVALVLAGLGFVYARMAQVQLDEHETWAREAVGLVRSREVIPYHRGNVLDRGGRLVVRDDDAYEIELVYRAFRREHPLGQVAHARSALEMRSVTMHRAAQNLVQWGLDLVRLSPRQVDEFREGQPLRLPDLEVPPGDARDERRAGRAGEVRFYVQALLGLDRSERSRLGKAIQKGGAGRSWVDLAAEVRGAAPSDLERELCQRLAASLADLEHLARLVQPFEEDRPALDSREEALVHLLEFLQTTRERIEGSVADELFERATGFPAGRLETDLLARFFALDWIAGSLRWSAEQKEVWIGTRRSEWEGLWSTLFVESAWIRTLQRDPSEHPANRWLGELASLYARGGVGRPQAWWRVDELVVLEELPKLFGLGGKAAAPVGGELPFQTPELRAAREIGVDPWELLRGMTVLPPEPEPEPELAVGVKRERAWRPPAGADEMLARLRALLGEGSGTRIDGDRTRLPAWFAAGWELCFQAALAERLEALVAAAGGAPLEIAGWRREQALEHFDYVLRDRSSRPIQVDGRPSYEVVYLLTRHPERFRGFRVRQTTRRIAMALDAEGRRVAPELIGEVRESTLEELIAQREDRRRLHALQQKRVRSDEERTEIETLVGHLVRSDEMRGSTGVEGLFDHVLRGENGYREREGLQEREDRGDRSIYVPKRDGRDLTLTLDLDLQAAALHTLEHPRLPAGEMQRDEVWFANPIGALVMITPDGQLLAAASVPRAPQPLRPGRDGQAGVVIDRTMRRPTHQPVGSVFKPFVAAYALDYLGLDPTQRVVCGPRDDAEGAGYGRVACHNKDGHGPIALDQAIHESCNAYFAWLGEQVGDEATFAELCTTFGFHRATGLAASGTGRGLREDFSMASLLDRRAFNLRELQQAGNGLNVIEATPLQVARATAALATGYLPELRVDLPGGGRPAGAGSPLPISAATLERIRRAMSAVVEVGTARGKRLGVADLGFRLAAKTGSADYFTLTPEMARGLVSDRPELPDMRKHTWLAGWFPAEAPVAVFVVYLHDVGFTSSHTAVHVASQFLRTEEVQRFVQENRP